MTEFLASLEVDRVGPETLLVKVKGPPGARGRHAALALQRPRLVRPQLGIERGVDAADWKGRKDENKLYRVPQKRLVLGCVIPLLAAAGRGERVHATYREGRPIGREVLKMRIWAVLPSCLGSR